MSNGYPAPPRPGYHSSSLNIVVYIDRVRLKTPHINIFKVNYLSFLIVKDFEKEIISQFVGIVQDCDQSGDRVSKSDKSHHICNIKLF